MDCVIWSQGHLRQLTGGHQPGSSASMFGVQHHCLHTCTRPPCSVWIQGKHQYMRTLARLGHERAGPHGTNCSSNAARLATARHALHARASSCSGTALVERMAMPAMSGAAHIRNFPWTSMLAAQQWLLPSAVVVANMMRTSCATATNCSSQYRPCMREHRCDNNDQGPRVKIAEHHIGLSVLAGASGP